MYLPQLVEIGRAEDAFGGPHLSDAEALLSAVPHPDAAEASSSSTCQLDRTVTVTE
jgi:hypothetical protein